MPKKRQRAKFYPKKGERQWALRKKRLQNGDAVSQQQVGQQPIQQISSSQNSSHPSTNTEPASCLAQSSQTANDKQKAKPRTTISAEFIAQVSITQPEVDEVSPAEAQKSGVNLDFSPESGSNEPAQMPKRRRIVKFYPQKSDRRWALRKKLVNNGDSKLLPPTPPPSLSPENNLIMLADVAQQTANAKKTQETFVEDSSTRTGSQSHLRPVDPAADTQEDDEFNRFAFYVAGELRELNQSHPEKCRKLKTTMLQLLLAELQET